MSNNYASGDRLVNVTMNRYSISGSIPVVSLNNGFVATIIGDTAAQVNGRLMFPSLTPATVLGDSRSWVFNRDEIYTGSIEIIFLAPIGANPLIEIEQKFYLK